MNATPPSHAPRSRGIDMLRGVAILMVMMAHLPFSFVTLNGAGSQGGTYPPAAVSNVMALGHYGVQLFLVISGYCIHMRWARVADRSRRLEFFAFWRRRLTRLYPPFVLVLAGSVAAVVVAHQVGPGTAVPWMRLGADITSLLLLVQNTNDASAHVGNPPFWSLALEEHLYLLYFPLLFLRRTQGWTLALIVPLATFAAWFALGVGLHFDDTWPHWQAMAFGYWFCWALGALAAEGHVGLVRLPGLVWCLAIFVTGLVAAAQCAAPLRDFLVTSSFFALVVAVTRMEEAHLLEGRSGARALVGLGTISYGTYLVHNPVFIVVKRALVAFGAPAPVVLMLRLAAGVFAGYVLYRCVESPFQKRSQTVRVRLIGGEAL